MPTSEMMDDGTATGRERLWTDQHKAEAWRDGNEVVDPPPQYELRIRG
jgi:hypothetical protein